MSASQELNLERLEELEDKMSELAKKCYFASARRVANEIRRVAREEGHFRSYVRATFTIMNNAGALLDPVSRRESAIEMISLLESEERARTIQPDLADDEYTRLVNWYSSCAYDNLAQATASISGQNSDGVHAGIAEGIDVCKKTGKTQCITCFREYATDVYFSADDLDMSLHYARMGLNQSGGKSDRRMAAAKGEINVLLTRGQLAEAADRVDRLIELAETWHNPFAARLSTKPLITVIAHLTGQPQRWQECCLTDTPPEQEDPSQVLRLDQMQAVIECIDGNYDAAITRLTPWDQKLLRKQYLDAWFGLRLRLLAAHRLAGNQREFERMAMQLQEKAVEARDWHVLRCLKYVRNEERPAPIPVYANLDCGPFAGPATDAESNSESNPTKPEPTETKQPEGKSDAESDPSETQEPPEFVVAILKRIKNAARLDEETQMVHLDKDEINRVIADILACDPEVSAESKTTEWLFHTVTHLMPDGTRAHDVWKWAKRIVAPVRLDARSLSLFAQLGSTLRFRFADQMADEIDVSFLEGIYRESLDLDPEVSGNFDRAGDFFQHMENLGEAERCFARSFRLDRSNAEVASKLARVYRQTERERDALAVLDIAVREGSEEPRLLWEAAVSAHNLAQHDATLTYLEAYEKTTPDEPWANHYRADALIALERFPEALTSVDREVELNPEYAFPAIVFRAACAAGMQEMDRLKSHLTEIRAFSLATVDYMSLKGLASMFKTLWNAVKVLDENDALFRQLQEFILASNLSPDGVFETHGRSSEVVDNVNYYRCVLNQPLDERWMKWQGRLANEENFKSYQTAWGVLAESEESAAELALQWQSRCYPLTASVVTVVLLKEGFSDATGVVWQGMRKGNS